MFQVLCIKICESHQSQRCQRCQDDKKRTPIHVAAASGNMKTTMLLLEAGMPEEKGEICFHLVHCPSNETRCFLQDKRRIPMVGVVVGVVVVLVR